MSPVRCWALSPETLAAIGGGDVRPWWFQWQYEPEDGEVLPRITSFHPADEARLHAWVQRATDIGFTPVLVLRDDERLDALADPPPEWSELMVLRVGSNIPDSAGGLEDELSLPDAEYLSAWSAYVQGRARLQPSPISAWPEFALAYSSALSAWRTKSPEHAAAAAERAGFSLDTWCGSPLCLEHFNVVARKSGDEVAFDLEGHPGAGLVKDMFGWTTTALLPTLRALDPDRYLERALQRVITDMTSKRPLAELLESVEEVSAAPRDRAPPEWTLLSTTSEPWKLEVYQPGEERQLPPAVLSYEGEDEPAEGDTIRLSFVCVDRAQHWSSPAKRITVNLAPSQANRRGAVPCNVSRDMKRWSFHLPARQLIQDPVMQSSDVVCVGISVSSVKP